MTEHAVVIAGAGPTGLMLAGELALAGVDVVVIERRPTQALAGSRAGGLHSRTLEIFDQRGIVERFLAEGQKAQTAGFAGVKFDISDFPTRHPYGLGLWQNRIERILAEWVGELGVPITYGVEVTGFVEDGSGIDIALGDGRVLRAQYLVGCDGGRSAVRKMAGIEFPGVAATTSNLIGEVEMPGLPDWGVHRNPKGMQAFGTEEYEIVDGRIVYKAGGPVRVLVSEAELGRTSEPTFDDLRAAFVATTGGDFGMHSPQWISRFTDATRQAAQYRKGRVLLAGDAAHIHSPEGGQGLQTGVQDAVNLGWKLAQVVKGTSPDSLLDSYHAERHPVGERVLRNTMAPGALRREDERSKAALGVVTELLGLEQAWRHMAAEMMGLAIRYDFGAGHPLLGRRMPDLDVVTADGAVRVFSLLHRARPVLLDFGAAGSIDVGAWADRVRLLDAGYAGAWELPAIGAVAAPGAVLVRPDGYVAWVGEGGEAGLADALTTWFGPPAAS